ncbi:MAG: PQQ-binding-like beta-propeller repeat protein [Nitrososphaerota archaeon]
MSDTEQRQGLGADSNSDHGSQRDTTPRLMVGSWAGEVAVVEARRGHVCWIRRTKREPGTFALDGEAAYFATGSTFAAIKSIQAARDLGIVQGRRLIAQADTPAQLEARRAYDGALLWTYAHPKIKGQLHVEAESRIVVAANPRHFEADVPPIQAFDGMSGKLLWEVEGRSAQWSSDRLVTVRGGRVYARLGEHLDDTITALNLRTGKPLWQRPWHDCWNFTPGGALFGEMLPGDGPMRKLTLIDARDGSELSSFSTEGMIRLITDEGIAYTDNRYEDAPWIAALDARTGAPLWRTSGVAHDHLALDGVILSYAHILPERRIVEVGALNAVTGERLWQWRSPATLGELVRLWGMRRMPAMLWDSTEKSVATIREIVGQRWFRLRGPTSRFREPPRQQTLGRRLHDIRRSIASNVGWPLWHEFRQGQWRHPWQLHDAMNANWLAARWGIVFLGTWLGLFALDATTGSLLWHALPTIDLSFVEPALAPAPVADQTIHSLHWRHARH